MVSIIIGSASDLEVASEAKKVLEDFGIKHELKVFSAHRTPEELRNYIKELEERNFLVIIACAGMAAALPGVIAAQTTLPVIGVPMKSDLSGLDSLLSISQMPKGIPVATMSIGKAGVQNAALFAVSILALVYPEYKEKIKKYRLELREEVLKANK